MKLKHVRNAVIAVAFAATTALFAVSPASASDLTQKAPRFATSYGSFSGHGNSTSHNGHDGSFAGIAGVALNVSTMKGVQFDAQDPSTRTLTSGVGTQGQFFGETLTTGNGHAVSQAGVGGSASIRFRTAQ